MARPRLNLSDEERRERRRTANRERKRRQASEDPEYRAKQAAYMRRLRAERSEYRAREARAKRERRLNDPGLRVVESYLRQARRCEANVRRKSLSTDCGHSCHVCGRLGVDANPLTLSSVLDNGERQNAVQIPREAFPSLFVGPEGTNVCETCRESLLQEADRSDDDRICTQEIKSEEVICGVDTFNSPSPSESPGPAPINNEIALLVPKREPEEIVCAVDCLDGYFPTHIDSSDGNVGPYSAKSKMEELGITTEGSDGPSLLGPPWLVSQCTK
uniref:Hkr1 gli-kruppel zinc finger family member n=1 Tax=Rhipicephalus zambeziensis TaxID=60191 RepID=A0A224YPT7_9ACAR